MTAAAAATRRITLWLIFGYVIVLALIAFWPTPVDRGAHDQLVALIGWLHHHGALLWLSYGVVEFSANIALFLPVGLLVGMLAGSRRWWIGIVVGFLTSCVIELCQLAFLPARFATISDVAANTAGAVVGTLCSLLLLRAIHQRHAPR